MGLCAGKGLRGKQVIVAGIRAKRAPRQADFADMLAGV
jgi:hypothetical protein